MCLQQQLLMQRACKRLHKSDCGLSRLALLIGQRVCACVCVYVNYINPLSTSQKPLSPTVTKANVGPVIGTLPNCLHSKIYKIDPVFRNVNFTKLHNSRSSRCSALCWFIHTAGLSLRLPTNRLVIKRTQRNTKINSGFSKRKQIINQCRFL